MAIYTVLGRIVITMVTELEWEMPCREGDRTMQLNVVIRRKRNAKVAEG